MKFILSTVGGAFIGLAQTWVVVHYSVLNVWILFPAGFLAFIIPGVHSDAINEAATLYNIVLYALLILGIWYLVETAGNKYPKL